LALSVPLSRFTSLVGGGSAFFVRPHDTHMKHFTIRIITMIVVQQAAMIFFMRGVRLDLFLSSGLAMLVGFTVYFIWGLVAARKTGL